MSHGPSLEALELRAAGALRMDGDERVADAAGRARPDHPTAFPDPSPLPAAAARAREGDPWRAALLAEGWLASRRRRARSELLRGLHRAAVKLKPEVPALPWESLHAALATEGQGPRREAIRAAADAAAQETVASARGLVDALRTGLDGLDPALRAGLALGEEGHGDLIAATDDLLRELDPWIARSLDLDPARLTWGDRLRSLAGPHTLAALPPATWAGLGAAAWDRLGLDRGLRGIVDELLPASVTARGVSVIALAPGERTAVAGRASRTGSGASEVLGAVAEAVSQTLGRGPSPGLRRGCDRALDGLAHALGRRVLCERRWLAREGGLDAAPRERVMLETIHAELLRVRLDAALAGFAAHVLARRPDAGQRFHAEVSRAWGVSPPPAWAPWVASTMLDGSGLWPARPAGRSLGARVEPLVVDALRERFDEDWFRNPQAGAGVAAIFDEVRAVGLRAWCEPRGGVPDATATVRRLSDALREARRSGPAR